MTFGPSWSYIRHFCIWIIWTKSSSGYTKIKYNIQYSILIDYRNTSPKINENASTKYFNVI